ncbi:PrsW family glutamic-type intramembrane protease [Citricoccus sp. NPDC079358]|uniref:PrsW family intramembrane metalloprotease n=1 Tax=Citricoccus sp. NPDC079358 TaxID=3154653 RepID=UPI00344DFD6E
MTQPVNLPAPDPSSGSHGPGPVPPAGLPGAGGPSPAAYPPAQLIARRSRRSHAWGVALLVATSAVGALVTLFLVDALGTETLFVVGLLALVPLAIVVAALLWIDRWDPEPRGWLVFAFLWGAGVSVFGTLSLGEVFMETFGGLSSLDSETFGAVVQAPVIEETMKGAGLVVIFLAARRHFDGPVDGVVYAGMVAAGFAFTENILYFGTAYTEAGWGTELAFTFVLRGLFSPFAHVLFTVWIGFFLGVAAHRRATRGRLSRVSWIGWFLVGLVPAMVGHFLWNGGLALIFDDFFTFYLVLQVPLFIAAVAAVVLLLRAERRLTQGMLDRYGVAGWLWPEEIALFGTAPGRRQGRRWASGHGVRNQHRAFERTALRLAALRHRIERGHDVQANSAEELRLLQDTVRQRRELFGAIRPGGPVSPAGSASAAGSGRAGR